jgi:serine/threonine protein kinase
MSAVPERGLVVGARYKLEAVLGEGGMAVVWRAIHTETDRKVALKLVRSELVRSDLVRDMFVREARVAARIGKSDHIVDVLDAGVDENLKVPFIAMELLDGESVEARIRQGPMPWSLVADLLEQLGDALTQAHAAGVFHRDLKPQNLFLTKDRKGHPLLKVLDFGIAKLSETTTSSATQVGTPAYAAPEQLGESWRSVAKGRGKTIAPSVSAGTDIWALGLIAFEMLTGTEPGAYWGATTLAELPLKIVIEPLPASGMRADPALLPAGFDPWIARCLELDAAARWPTPHDAVNALVPLLRGTGAAADLSSPLASTSRGPRASIPDPAALAATGLANAAASQPQTAGTPNTPNTPNTPDAARPLPSAASRAASHAPYVPSNAPLPVPPPRAPQRSPSHPGTPLPPRPPAMGGPPPHTAPPGHWPSSPSPSPSPMHAAYTGPIDPRLTAWVARWRAELRTPGDPRTF